MCEVLSAVIKLVELVFKFGERPKVSIKANEFHYDCLNDDTDSSVVVITPYPSRYYANLAFSNVGRRLTTIKQITVLINGELELPHQLSSRYDLSRVSCVKRL